MKTKIQILTSLALTIVLFGQHSTASAVNMYNFRGLGTTASFSRVEGCLRTNVDVFTAEAILQTSPGSGDPYSSVNVFINQHDFCTDPETQVLAAEGVIDLAEADLETDPKLNWATLNTTMSVTNALTGNLFDISINLTWTASAPVTREHSVLHENTPGCIHVNRFVGTFRAAEASGSVSDSTTNFTPEHSLGALLVSSKSADMSIDCLD